MFAVLIFILIFAAFMAPNPKEKERNFQRQMVQECLQHNPTTDVCKDIIKKYMDKK